MNTGIPPRLLQSDRSLLRFGAAAWAWEWLRRNERYAEVFAESNCGRRRRLRATPLLEVIELSEIWDSTWGLCIPEAPERSFTDGGVFWRAEVDPTVISVAAIAGRNSPEAINLCRLDSDVRILKFRDGEQVCVSNGLHAIQMRVVDGTVLDGAVHLAHLLPGPDALNERLSPLRRLAILQKQKRFPAKTFPPNSYASKWLLALKAIDMERAGFSHPEIATQLYQGVEEGGFATDWRRSRLRRLLDTGHAMIGGEYLKILARSAKVGRRAA